MNTRTLLVFLHDMIVSVVAWCGGYWLRFNFEIPPTYESAMFSGLLIVVPVQVAIFHIFGLYRGMWRFASLPDLKRILMYEEFQGHPLRKDYPINKRQPRIGPKV